MIWFIQFAIPIFSIILATASLTLSLYDRYLSRTNIRLDLPAERSNWMFTPPIADGYTEPKRGTIQLSIVNLSNVPVSITGFRLILSPNKQYESGPNIIANNDYELIGPDPHDSATTYKLTIQVGKQQLLPPLLIPPRAVKLGYVFFLIDEEQEFDATLIVVTPQKEFTKRVHFYIPHDIGHLNARYKVDM